MLRKHRCPSHARTTFANELTSFLTDHPNAKGIADWLDRPICVCVFDQPEDTVGRALTLWTLDFDERCARILDLLCPPLAVGVWAPDGSSSQFLLLSACLEGADGSPLATIDVSLIIFVLVQFKNCDCLDSTWQ